MAGEQGFTLWFTGLSGAGKTTSKLVVSELEARGSAIEVLDGDVVRQNLSKGLDSRRRTGTPTSAASPSSPISCRATACR